MPDSWNPPTGPPNGAPVHPADAKREIEEATAAARAHHEALRGRAAELAAARVEAEARRAAATSEAQDARALAKRALGRANESARAGQRAEAAKWTGAAQVFAMRLRDARVAAIEAEASLTASGGERAQLDAALSENVGRLQAVAAARLPVLSGRKAARSQALVDETVAAISASVSDVVARAEVDARAALAAADEAASEVAEVADDDLEREVDFAGTDEILDELRAELGLPMVGPTSEDETSAPTTEARPGRSAPGDAADVTPGQPPVPHTSGARS